MALGDRKSLGGAWEPVRKARASAQSAARRALSAYLERAVFRIYGEDAADTTFSLTTVFPRWPNGNQEIPYPCAAFVEDEVFSYQATSPYGAKLLEDTYEQFGKDTVLWRLGEERYSLQLDFFTNADAHREAIEAELGNLFMPEEGTSSIVLEGPAEYFCRPMRFTLEDASRIDTPDAMFANERRLRCVVLADVEILSLRRTVPFTPAARLQLSASAPEAC